MSQKGYAMNPAEVKTEGTKLQENAQSILNEINRLVKYNDQLKQIWKGTGSETYFAKWDEKKQSINKLQNWLEEFANATVNSAKMAQETDSNVSSRMK